VPYHNTWIIEISGNGKHLLKFAPGLKIRTFEKMTRNLGEWKALLKFATELKTGTFTKLQAFEFGL